MQQQIINVLQILPFLQIPVGGFYQRKGKDMGDTRFEPNSFGGNEMKKRSILILVIVLTLAVFTGCGCRNSKPMDTMPTTIPTTEATEASKATTTPTQATQPSMPTNQTESTNATVDNGNGPLPTDESVTPGDSSRTRRIPGNH